MIDVILLFDMDGVLLEPRGYHRALQQTVKLLGAALGFAGADLSQEDIYQFEALGITSEWDSAAVCRALLLKTCWEQIPASRRRSDISIEQNLQPPDWNAFLTAVQEQAGADKHPVRAAGEVLEGDLPAEKRTLVRAILEEAHQPSSLTHRTFQEFVLGSDTFEEIYAFQPQIGTGSYLNRYDQPGLSAQQQKALAAWFNPHRRGSVVTNRPTRPPGLDTGSPEGEMGAALVGLGELPLIGYGELTWLGARIHKPVPALRKPNPTHALAGLLAAAGMENPRALEIGFQLAEGKHSSPAQKLLHQSRVIIYEDTTAGLISLKAAARILNSLDIQLEITLVGIAADHQKRRALAEEGAEVYPNLNDALQTVPGIS